LLLVSTSNLLLIILKASAQVWMNALVDKTGE
jgi:hypothetical protein